MTASPAAKIAELDRFIAALEAQAETLAIQAAEVEDRLLRTQQAIQSYKSQRDLELTSAADEISATLCRLELAHELEEGVYE